MNTKLYLSLFLLVLFSCGYVNEVMAQQVKIVTELFYPFQQLDEKDELGGYSVDVVEALWNEAQEVGEPNIDILPWSVAYDRALKQPNTMIFSMSRSAVREDKFLWLAPIASEKPYFWALASANITKSNQLSDFSQYRIAVIKDAVNHQYLANKGFDNLYLMAGMDANATEAHRIRMLLAGRADIVISPKATIVTSLESLNQPQGLLQAIHRASDLDNKLYIAFNIDTEPFIFNRYQQAMKRLLTDGELARLKQKWQID